MEMNARIDTPETIRERAMEAFGFNEPSALDAVDRNKYGSEDAYIDACVKAEMERSNPEYRAVRSRLKAEYRQRQEEQQREAQSAAYQTIRASVGLDGADRRDIDQRATEMAHRDLAANRIAASELGAAIEKYAADLGEQRKNEKASAQLFNAMLRGQV